MKRIICIIFLSFTLLSCGGGSENKDSNSQDQPQIAQNYVVEILQIMKEHAITKYDVDWGKIETEVNALAANAKSIQDTYPAINKALELLKTNHSSLYSASGKILAYHSDFNCDQLFDINEPQIDNIGYIRVDSFSGSNDSSNQNFSTNIQKEISRQDSATLKGWIVDLRDNSGGNMWPMIAGLGPLLDDGLHGYFIDADEQISSWGYENGSSYLEENKIVTVEEPYILLNPLPKIAVLSSRRVASSGEATLIAFKKQNNVRVFGTDSCGLSTGNQSFSLSDGSKLNLTTIVMADREQLKYGGRIPVDQSEAQSDVVNKAVEWINQ